MALGWQRLVDLGPEYRDQRLILLGWALGVLDRPAAWFCQGAAATGGIAVPACVREKRRADGAGESVKLIEVKPDDLTLSPELSRSGSAKQFEERLQSSIEEIGLAEPLKVARQPGGGYLVIDGTMRLRAIRAIRDKDPSRFKTVAIYVLDYARRYEIRYQSDIYQDLLPSQLATLVEHLHRTENVLKVDIARYIGVSPATLRNYTGLWRLLERGGLFARVVELMDVEVFPSSNPYAWLRLTDSGLRKVLS